MKRKLFILIIIVSVLSVVLFLISFLPASRKNNSSPSEPSPSPTPSSAEIKIETGFINDPASDEQEIKSLAVGNLIQKLPIKKANFSFYFSFSTNKFTLYLDPRNIALANSQFETFLKENGVEKEWIKNLETVDRDITPAP